MCRQVTLVTSAPAAAEAARARGEDLAGVQLPPDSVAVAGAPFSEAELQVGASMLLHRCFCPTACGHSSAEGLRSHLCFLTLTITHGVQSVA